jgi:hypothetical protein
MPNPVDCSFRLNALNFILTLNGGLILFRHYNYFTVTLHGLSTEDSVAETVPPSQIFLSYAPDDREMVEDLYQKLLSAGFKPWMDDMDILPGENRLEKIRSAIERSDFFLACLSANSTDKRGGFQRELKFALDVWEEMPPNKIYLIPIKLAQCVVPESIKIVQPLELFKPNGFALLEKSLKKENSPTDIASSEILHATPGPKSLSLSQIITPALLSNLHQGMVKTYSLEELRTLCMELGVDYENLGGDGKDGKIRELISYLNRRRQLSKLIEKCKMERPDYPWPPIESIK